MKRERKKYQIDPAFNMLSKEGSFMTRDQD